MSFYDDDPVPTLISADEMRAKLTAEGVHLESNAAKGVLYSGDAFADRSNQHYRCEPVPRVPAGTARADVRPSPTTADLGDSVAEELDRQLGRTHRGTPIVAAPHRTPSAADLGDSVADELDRLLGRGQS